jgi:chemotaxis protein MotA
VDKSTITGITLAVGAIGLGLLLEGGRLTQILQPTAAIIVFGGTLGAVLVQFPLPLMARAVRELRGVFWPREPKTEQLVQNLVRYAHKARREGLLSLDAELASVRDPFLKECLMLAVDGVNVHDLKKMMDLQLDYRAEKDERVPKVFEAAAGFAPTVGILGAVLGLIQVMQHLQDIDAVGRGIAAAFVSTLYGVGMANILFMPWAGRLKIRLRDRQVLEEMTLNGVLSIIEGVHPRALELQLTTYLPGTAGKIAVPRTVPRKVASR